jgi:hypothetical protein
LRTPGAYFGCFFAPGVLATSFSTGIFSFMLLFVKNEAKAYPADFGGAFAYTSLNYGHDVMDDLHL